MPDANEHARIILAAIIPNRRDSLDKALRHLTPEHFQDTTLRNIFQMLDRIAMVTGEVMTHDHLADALRSAGADAGRMALYLETYDSLHAQLVSDADFRWSLEQVRELAAERATGEAFAQGMEILRTGANDDKGHLVKGHREARAHVLEQFSQIDRGLQMQESPEGDMRKEADQMLADYANRKMLHTSGGARGVLFGIPDLDFKIGGLQKGELDLIAGYTSDGKTTLCTQLHWSAVVEQGLNSVYLTTETLRPQIQRKVISRHSVLPQFGLADGFNTRDLKNGTLPEVDERKLPEVIADFTRNPSYGASYIAQVPRGATLSQVEAILYRISRLFRIDVCIVDYLRLLRPSVRRSSDREELGSLLVESKQIATTFDDGNGLCMVSPWQVNRTSRDEAERSGYYSSKALSETAEASNTPDVIVSMLAPSDNESRYAEVKFQILKNRDGETALSIPVDVDYATSKFGSKRRASGVEDSSVSVGPGGEFDHLLG